MLPITIPRWRQKTGGEMESRTDDVTPTDNNVAEGETRLKREKSFAIGRFSSSLSLHPLFPFLPMQSWSPPTFVRFLHPEGGRPTDQFRCITGRAMARLARRGIPPLCERGRNIGNAASRNLASKLARRCARHYSGDSIILRLAGGERARSR